MSTTHATDASAAPAHRLRTGIILGVVIAVLAIAAGIANMMLSTRNDHRPYSPASLDPNGGGALAQLLTDAGVDVVHAQTAADLKRANATTTVLLIDPMEIELEEEDANALKESGATIILLGTSSWWSPDAWGFGEDAWTSALAREDEPAAKSQVSARSCTPATLVEADADGSTLGPVSQVMVRAQNQSHCFDATYGSAWIQSERYPQVFYFGAATALTNQYLGEFDNAGVAMRALSQHPTLLWVEGYTPGDVSALAATGKLPAWLFLAFVAAVASGAWFMLVSARRFGKLVAEPLPVAVPAEEANTGRARLYRTNRDLAHAARVLRSAFIARHAQRLGLAANATPTEVALAVASACHGDPEAVMRTLYTQPIDTQTDLAQLASAVGDLEKEFTHDRS